MENFTLVFLSLMIGLALQKVKAFKNGAPVLNHYVIYVAFPALVFVQLPKIQLNADLLLPLLTPYMALGLSVALILFLQKSYQWSKGTLGALLLTVPLGNTSFLGFPMLSALLGDKAVAYGVIYDQLGSFLILSFYGPFVVSLLDHQHHFSWKKVAHKLVAFPPFLALFVAFVTWPLAKPEWLMANMQRLGETLVPVAMVAVGLQLKFKLPRHLLSPLLWGFGLKLVLVPLIVYGFFTLFGWQDLVAQATLLEVAMPAMIAAGIVATSANFNPPLVAALVAWGVLLSLLSLPLWKWLMTSI